MSSSCSRVPNVSKRHGIKREEVLGSSSSKDSFTTLQINCLIEKKKIK